MISIHVQLLQGAGRTALGGQLTFARSPVTFGRSEQGNVVVAESTASRQHGELRWDGQQWVAFNLSANGTSVDGHPIGRKGTPLRGGEVFSVGDAPLFRVRLGPSVAAASALPASTDAEPGARAVASTGASAGNGPEKGPNAPEDAPRSPKRVMLWTGIAVYMLIMVGVIVFVDTLVNKPDEVGGFAPALTPAQIQRDVTKPVRVSALDPGEANRSETLASELFNKLDTAPRNLYDAYHYYRLSLAYAGKDAFEPGESQLRFQTVETRLIEAVSKQYKETPKVSPS
ncbi:MAG: FHA domain-containing protein [Planctomycetota bacterium]|nr:FHA domain-containing protein [Planctomycetota bacterium]